MQERDSLSKIFRVALLIFATTFGVGLYALIGAPVLRINYGNFLSGVGDKIASVGGSALASFPALHLIPQKGAISFELTTAANDIPLLRNTIERDDFGNETTREIVFTDSKGNAVSGKTLFTHFLGWGIPDDLGHLLLNQRYFIKHDSTYHGVLFVSVLDEESTYAGMLQYEQNLSSTLLSLTHPTMSQSEVRMFAQLRFVSRKIADIDARAITTSDDTPILIWGLHKGILIVAGNRESFAAATKE